MNTSKNPTSIIKARVYIISIVTRFAKRTGDYGSLSPVDLKLISLTYQLHCELEPTAQLRKDPPKEVCHLFSVLVC